MPQVKKKNMLGCARALLALVGVCVCMCVCVCVGWVCGCCGGGAAGCGVEVELCDAMRCDARATQGSWSGDL